MLEWTQAQVHNWLLQYKLIQMSRLLIHCDGRSLIYRNKYMTNCQSQEILNLSKEELLK